MKYKVLSLWDPWATMIALGKKKIETRSWGTSYRGPLAIHVSKSKAGIKPLLALRDWALGKDISFSWGPYERLVLTTLHEAGYKSLNDLPFGKIICTCDLTACVMMDNSFILWSMTDKYKDDYLLGNYEVGRWAWRLENVKILEHPVAVSGKQGLWEYEGELK